MELTDDPLYTPAEAAGRLRSNARTLERWRTTGDGPAFVKVGRRVCYPRSALDDFVQRRTRHNTTEKAGR
jgi:excisionase family DNA binding protein